MAITLDLLDSAFHSVEIKTAAGQALAIDGSGFLTISNSSFEVTDGGGSLTVDAVDLDIRNLNVATNSDHVYLTDSTGANALDIDASGFITIANTSFTVTASDLDIRDITHVSDSIKVGNGTDFLEVNSDGSLNVNAQKSGFGSWLVSVESVDNTVGGTELVATPLTGRVSVLIQNLSSQDIYLREATGVTTDNGLRLPKGSCFSADLDEDSNIFAISGSGSASDIRIVEYAI